MPAAVRTAVSVPKRTLAFSSGDKLDTPYTSGTLTPRSRRSPNESRDGNQTEATKSEERARRVSIAFQTRSSATPKLLAMSAITTRTSSPISRPLRCVSTCTPSGRPALPAKPAKIHNTCASFCPASFLVSPPNEVISTHAVEATRSWP